MIKLRMFRSDNITDIMIAYNEWIRKNPKINIQRTTQSESCISNLCGSQEIRITISIWYEE